MSLRKEEAHWMEPLPLLAWALGGFCLGLVAAGIALVLPYRHLPNLNVSQQFASAFIGVTFASVGVFLAVRQPRNPVGWIFLAIGLSQSLSAFAVYGEARLRSGPPGPPGAPLPIALSAESIGRYAQEIEAGVYFCCLEALQNVTKYANASTASVSLSETDGRLTFQIRDDGVGFDPQEAPHGTGLQGMADRLSALGGDLDVRSEPGRGTTVTGTVPWIRGAPT